MRKPLSVFAAIAFCVFQSFADMSLISPALAQREEPRLSSVSQDAVVDSYLDQIKQIVEPTWHHELPPDVQAPTYAAGEAMIQFRILRDGRIGEGRNGMRLVERAGFIQLDRTAWGAIVSAKYPPLPKDFTGPFLEVRIRFKCKEGRPSRWAQDPQMDPHLMPSITLSYSAP